MVIGLEYVLDNVLESVFRVRAVAAGVRCVKVFAGGIWRICHLRGQL